MYKDEVISLYKDTKWAKGIIALQDTEGAWGHFHTLSASSKSPISTEQALRRLYILGYTINDISIQKSVEYMIDCLRGKKAIPDRREKTHNWDIFTELMLSTWIRKFTSFDENANKVAYKWAEIITHAFSSGRYNHNDYINAYCEVFGEKPRGGRLVDFVSFYQISILSNMLDKEIEQLVIDYVINHKNSIYYIYDKPISQLPKFFMSKETSRYISAIELLSNYKYSHDKLYFVVDWLNDNRNNNEMWDMGGEANDKIYFPLSDNWRSKSTREQDCTYRIQKLIDKILEVV